jgi:hypothetical protein
MPEIIRNSGLALYSFIRVIARVTESFAPVMHYLFDSHGEEIGVSVHMYKCTTVSTSSSDQKCFSSSLFLVCMEHSTQVPGLQRISEC